MDRTEKRVWGYCRCGGIDQAKMEKQAEQLKQYAESCGYTFFMEKLTKFLIIFS